MMQIDTGMSPPHRGDSHQAGHPASSFLTPALNGHPHDTKPRCLVVMYHYIHDVKPITSHGLNSLTGRQFRTQLEALSGNMEPIDWPTLYAAMSGRRSLPQRCFLLTFDDGLADHRDDVLPVLQDLGLRGVFFVPGQPLTAHRMLPAHEVHFLLATLGPVEFRRHFIEALSHKTGNHEALQSVDKDRAEATYHYESKDMAHLKYLITFELPIDLRNDVIAQLFGEHIGSTARWARTWYLGWDDLVAMQSAGHTIGGHGFSHESYARLDKGQRRADLRRISETLEDGLGPDLRPFSYPYGGWSPDAASDCRQAGFPHAFTTVKGWTSTTTAPMQIPRVDTIDVDLVLSEEQQCSQAS